MSEGKEADLDEPSRLLDQMENAALREQLADLLFEDVPELCFDDALLQVIIRKFQFDLGQLDRMIIAEPTNLEIFKQKAALMDQFKAISTKKVVHHIIV
jgi:hypothetical protein